MIWVRGTPSVKEIMANKKQNAYPLKVQIHGFWVRVVVVWLYFLMVHNRFCEFILGMHFSIVTFSILKGFEILSFKYSKLNGVQTDTTF